MRGRRREKTERVIPFSNDSSSDDESEEEVPPEPPRKLRLKGKADLEKRAKPTKEEQEDSLKMPPLEEIEANLAFCCATCACSERRKARVNAGDDAHCMFTQGTLQTLWHRRCCHGIWTYRNAVQWVPPILETQEELFKLKFSSIITEENAAPSSATTPTKEDETATTAEQNSAPCARAPEANATPSATIMESRIYRKADIVERYNRAKRRESELYNQDHHEHPAVKLTSSKDYVKMVSEFEELVHICEEAETKAQAVVLDMFAGVGTGVVVLKKLGIAMSKVIHVEHDKVANFVYKENHDRRSNPSLADDGIEHVYYAKFEEIDNHLEKFMMEHGPIDIIIGGPPCQDYCGANAAGQGRAGARGRYMQDFGSLIRRIKHSVFQRKHPLFFLSENVTIQNQANLPLHLADREQISGAYGINWDPVELDAKYVSPCHRKRIFFMNVPLELHEDFFTEHDAADSTPSSTLVLEDGYQLAAHWIQPCMIAKIPTFWASGSRMDDESQMTVFKKISKKKYLGRLINLKERENAMGYPKGYISRPISDLFPMLLEKGHMRYYLDRPWFKELPRKYFTFAGAYHGLSNGWRFEATMEGVQLEMAPPVEFTQPTYLKAERYGKHLVGNAYSVPVVEALLKPLQHVFAHQDYEGFDYHYLWEEES